MPGERLAGRNFGLYGHAQYFAEPALVADTRCARLADGEFAEPERTNGDVARAGEPLIARLCLARIAAVLSEDRDGGGGDVAGAQLDRRARRSPRGLAALALLVPLRADRDRRHGVHSGRDGAEGRRTIARHPAHCREIRARHRWAV